MNKDYQIAKKRINKCIKNKSYSLYLSRLEINKIPKLIKKCKNHLLNLHINYTDITYISNCLYKLKFINVNDVPLKHYPIISLNTRYSSSDNCINRTEYMLYHECIWNHSCLYFIQIIITIKYIQRLYRKYLFYLDFYSVY